MRATRSFLVQQGFYAQYGLAYGGALFAATLYRLGPYITQAPALATVFLAAPFALRFAQLPPLTHLQDNIADALLACSLWFAFGAMFECIPPIPLTWLVGVIAQFAFAALALHSCSTAPRDSPRDRLVALAVLTIALVCFEPGALPVHIPSWAFAIRVNFFFWLHFLNGMRRINHDRFTLLTHSAWVFVAPDFVVLVAGIVQIVALSPLFMGVLGVKRSAA